MIFEGKHSSKPMVSSKHGTPWVRHANSVKDNGYSISERMKFAGHNNADTFFGSYAPELSTVDGMASY